MFIDKLTEPIKKWLTKEEENIQNDENIVELPPNSEVESVEVEENLVSWGFSYEMTIKNIKQLVLQYRDLATNFEIDQAIEDIVNQSIIYNDDNVVNINLDKTKFSDSIKTKIQDEFANIIQLLDFNNTADETFKKWYIDGRLYLQDIVNDKKPKDGILKMNILSPLDISRYKDPETKKYYYIWKQDETDKVNKNNYMYSDHNKEGEKIWKIPEQLITFVPSGISDKNDKFYISHLQKSVKPFNQLKLIEDSAVIYRITRAPERRVFYVDVGKLPKKKAEAYLQKLINKFKNKISYDSSTGKVNQNKKSMTLLEDFYIPRSSDQKGTQIETLQNGNLIDKVEDINYFKKKLNKSLGVPTSRLDTDDNPVVNLGQSGEITREELKFSRFCNKLQKKFSVILLDPLKKQLLLKNIITIQDWKDNRQLINLLWEKDSYFEELKDSEILTGQVELADSMEQYIGKYFSHDTIRKQIFKQSDEDIKSEDKQILAEKDLFKDEEEEDI